MASKKILQSINKFRKDILSGELPYGYLLPSEKVLAESMQLSRPTVSKIYDTLRGEGLIQKKKGYGTSVIYTANKKSRSFGLLFPGAGESEIFGLISDYFLNIEEQNDVKFLRDGAVAYNAEIRKNNILEACQMYIENKVDGVFFAPLERIDIANTLNKNIYELIDKNNIPLILLDRDVDKFPTRSKYPVVGLDNYSAGYLMTKHLIENGGKKIIFLSRRESASSVYKRIMGCKSCCFDYGIPFDKSNMVIGDPSDINTVKAMQIVSGETAVICGNDATAATLMLTLGELGLEVTRDLIMAGFDDMKYAKVLQVPLTSYRQPLLEIVETSYEMMLNRLVDKKKTALNIDISGKIIVRDSSTFKI